jgi:hypothetical protein
VIEDVVDAVAAIFGANLSPPRFVPIKFVNVDTLRRMLVEAPVTCARYDSVFDIIAGSFRLAVGKPLCETLRYLYPVPWLYDLASGVLGWASLDPAPLSWTASKRAGTPCSMRWASSKRPWPTQRTGSPGSSRGNSPPPTPRCGHAAPKRAIDPRS